MPHLTHDDIGLPVTAPAIGIFQITPDDETDLPHRTRGISVTEAGTVAVMMMNGTEGTFFVAAGVMFPAMAIRIKATGTTATGIAGFY